MEGFYKIIVGCFSGNKAIFTEGNGKRAVRISTETLKEILGFLSGCVAEWLKALAWKASYG